MGRVRRSRRMGFTLVEVMVVSLFVAFVIGACMRFLSSATLQFNTLAPIDQIQDLGRDAIDRMAEDIRASQATTFILQQNYGGSGSSYIQAQEAIGWSAGITQWKTIEWYLVPSSIDADGDGNKTNDWKLTRYDNGLRVVDTNYVAQGGFQVTVSPPAPTVPQQVLITLTMVTHNSKMQATTVTFNTAAWLRN